MREHGTVGSHAGSCEDLLAQVGTLRSQGRLHEAASAAAELEARAAGAQPYTALLRGGIELARGEATEACRHYRRALRGARETNDLELGLTAMLDMAAAELGRGRVLVAMALLDASYRRAVALGDRVSQGRALGLMGRIEHHDLGGLEEGRFLYEEALVAFGDAGRPDLEASALRWLGELAADEGQTYRALHLFREALDAARVGSAIEELRRLEENLGKLVRRAA